MPSRTQFITPLHIPLMKIHRKTFFDQNFDLTQISSAHFIFPKLSTMWETVHIKVGTLRQKLNDCLSPNPKAPLPNPPPVPAYHLSPLLLSAYLEFYVPLYDYFFNAYLPTELQATSGQQPCLLPVTLWPWSLAQCLYVVGTQ